MLRGLAVPGARSAHCIARGNEGGVRGTGWVLDLRTNWNEEHWRGGGNNCWMGMPDGGLGDLHNVSSSYWNMDCFRPRPTSAAMFSFTTRPGQWQISQVVANISRVDGASVQPLKVKREGVSHGGITLTTRALRGRGHVGGAGTS